MIKINLDIYDIKEILKLVFLNTDKVIVFYNSKNWNSLNKDKIFKLIIYLEKLDRNITYKFYNIPFCLFKIFWMNYINNHCILDKLCNYYKWYITHWKCNRCTYWLFCNNFNWKISESEFNGLDWYYEDTINNENLLEKLVKIKKWFISLWYKESEISFYVRQKYTYNFLLWYLDEISKEHMKYFIVYVLVKNDDISKKLFVDINYWILLFKDDNLIGSFNDFLKEIWFAINVVCNKAEVEDIKTLAVKNEKLRISRYFSVYKYLRDNYFLNFNKYDISSNTDTNKFQWKVYNSMDFILSTTFKLVKNPNDAVYNTNDIYIWRDIILWNWINNYKWILLTTDKLWINWRFTSSKSGIKIPVIYDIKPNLLNLLKDWDKIVIDFNTWVIQKC